jgi:hypothetical protein
MHASIIIKPTKNCEIKGEERGGGQEKSNWRNEFDQNIIYVCMEISQWKPFLKWVYANFLKRNVKIHTNNSIWVYTFLLISSTIRKNKLHIMAS